MLSNWTRKLWCLGSSDGTIGQPKVQDRNTFLILYPRFSGTDSSLHESVQQVSSKPSISNQRILEDLSHSKSSYLTFQQQPSSVKPDQDKISSRSRMMFGEQHYTGTFGEIDDQRQLVHQNLNGLTSSEGSGTSIHISFNDNYMTETNIVHNQPKQWEFNNVPHSSNENGALKSSCRWVCEGMCLSIEIYNFLIICILYQS